MTPATLIEPDVPEISELEDIARRIRGEILRMIHRSKTMHLGSSFSCVEILVAAYWAVLRINPEEPDVPDRDRFILSKGHAAPALLAVLAEKGFIPKAELEGYCEDGGHLAEHPTVNTPGVEAATGSLGHGFPMGLGMAWAGRQQGRHYRVYSVLSDAECNEGSTWEGAMVAPAKGLENVCAIVDFNDWQATDRSTEIVEIEPLADKWEAFGWSTKTVDGHDLGGLVEAMRDVPDGSGRPVAIIADTTKGKGVWFMEDDNNWHYRTPSDEELERAYRDLGLT